MKLYEVTAHYYVAANDQEAAQNVAPTANALDLHNTCQKILLGATSPEHKSLEEIEALKANWRADPCWDLENTEGFERYKGELLRYRHQMEIDWRDKSQARLIKMANDLDIPGKVVLVEYLERLQAKIDDLSHKLTNHIDNG